MRFVALLIISLSSCACGNASADVESQTTLIAAADPEAARDEAVAKVNDQTFEEVGDTSTCTNDCSGHDAGFEWGKDQGANDSSECTGNSQSFIEGCEAYVTAVEEARDEAGDGSDS